MNTIIENIKKYNRWRRGDMEEYPMSPKEIGIALDTICNRVEELENAIHQTLMENLHLADGDICTLKVLKDSIDFKLTDEEYEISDQTEI